ncbi:MAG: hypothetical protein J1F27_03650 [Prevotellaceae bacterium]|nr:hypothetical protein [Prevotellaceae bacterium]
MRDSVAIRTFLLLLAIAMCWPAYGAVRKRRVSRSPDTLMVPFMQPEMPLSKKMNTSIFPVQITTTGRMVQIQSDHNQLLPIYTRSGALFLTARLNKGTNWLGGLPRGHYFINNRPITIN